MNHEATISLHMDGTRQIRWGLQHPDDLDMLYYTHKALTDKEKEMIDSITEGNVVKINAILSNYI